MKRLRGIIGGLGAVALISVGCSATPTPTPEAVPTTEAPTLNPTQVPTGEAPGDPQTKEMSQEDCAAKGGSLVGDIGNGAIHRPEYRCPSGSPPIGRVALGVEGSVCCL